MNDDPSGSASLSQAQQHGLLDFEHFNVNEYEHYEVMHRDVSPPPNWYQCSGNNKILPYQHNFCFKAVFLSTKTLTKTMNT